MPDPALKDKLAAMDYEARYARVGLPLLFMLLPLLVFAALTYREVGYLSPVATTAALATYALVLALGARWARRDAMSASRRDSA